MEDGVAEEVPCEQYAQADGRPVSYLPHHAVIREGKQTTKVRVVFDASARDLNGVSLNSCLETGPALHPDLVGILLLDCVSMLKMKLSVLLAALSVGRTVLPASQWKPFLLTVSWRFSHCWILVFGDIAQGRIIQQIYLAEAYLSASLERVSCGGKGPNLQMKQYKWRGRAKLLAAVLSKLGNRLLTTPGSASTVDCYLCCMDQKIHSQLEVERRRETFNSFNWTRDTRGRRMADSPCTENKF